MTAFWRDYLPLTNSKLCHLFQELPTSTVYKDGKQNQRPSLGLRIHSEYCYGVQETWPNHELLPIVIKQLIVCAVNQTDSHQEDCVAQEQQQVGMDDPFHNFDNNRSQADWVIVTCNMFVSFPVDWNNISINPV